ncbi:MAG: FKBP-type peptidyl-prolyl cis-trans isomerase [Bacteroidia bacterium]|nr:FKBP-type peptidyl-prolyl cis-trans isomerase [Bacteroidia bacterium]
MMILRLFSLVLIFFMLFSCGGDCDVELIIPESVNNTVAMQNDAEIQDYIMANGLSTEMSESGLYYSIDDPGGSIKPDLCQSVTAIYTGYLTNGIVFDSSGISGATFPLGNVVLGWQEGIPLFGKNGKGTLLIPSKLGYGPNSPSSKIPANSVLVFDIEILDFQ